MLYLLSIRNHAKEILACVAVLLVSGGLAVLSTVSGPSKQPSDQLSNHVATNSGPKVQQERSDRIASQPTKDSRGRVRLSGEVPTALEQATKIRVAKVDNAPLSLTVVLNRTDQQGFESFLREVQDPQSPSYRHYLNPLEQANRFGPSPQAYHAVLAWLRRNDFRLLEGSANRLTLTVRAARPRAQQAFGVEIGDYQLGNKTFYANDREPAVPAKLAPHIQAVVGLTNLGQPNSSNRKSQFENAFFSPEQAPDVRAVLDRSNSARPRPSYNQATEAVNSTCFIAARSGALYDPEYLDCTQGPEHNFYGPGICNAVYDAVLEELYKACVGNYQLYDLFGGNGPALRGPGSSSPSELLKTQAAAPLRWLDVDGTGQKIGLLEFDSFNINDIKDYLALAGYPATDINRLSKVDVNGGAVVGPEEAEVLIDIIAVMTNARGANVVVYDAPFNNIRTSFQTLFNRMIGDGVTIISNSWVYCEDQATLADVQSIDSVLASAAAAGISVLNSTGDFGSTCVNGSGNTISVPADSPHATAVGGTSLNLGPAFTYGNELYWNGSNQTPPTGAGGFGVSRFFSRPTYQNGFNSSAARSVPDVSLNGDPAKGIQICQADAGGCPTRATYGGTSLSAPIWAAFVALLNQAQGQNLGQLNPILYSLGNTNAFHSAASMGSDFNHVGLGSPNLNLIHRALTGKTAGPVSVEFSQVTADPNGAVADGIAEAFVVVRLQDAKGHTVSGKTVTLAANTGSHATIFPASGVSNIANGAVIFSIKDVTPEILTFTATDTSDGVVLQKQVRVAFVSRPAAAGGISASPTTVTANGSDTTTITVTLQDANGNPSPNKVINLSQGNGASIISATTAVTDATGKVQFTAVSNKSEIVTYTAVDVTDRNLPIPGNAAVNFVNASGFCAGTGSYRFGTAAPGYAVTTFASNFPNDCFGGVGPLGLVFDANANLLVGDVSNSTLYVFGSQGGIAGPATQVGVVQPGGGLAGLAFSKDGRLYAVLKFANKVVELNPATGAIIRTVVNTGGGSVGLAVDPLSGDLFVSDFDAVRRISNFATGPGTLTTYFSASFIDGIVFAPDGTLYVSGNSVYRVAGTNSPNPGASTALVQVATSDGIAIEPNPANPSKPFLYLNRNDGKITRVDTSALPNDLRTCDSLGGPACIDIYTGGSRGDFVTVSPSGCLYATQSERVIKITKADGTCSLSPTSLAPQIVLTPENVKPSPAQGTPVSFTATLKNVANPANIPITLFVSGANSRPYLVRTDNSGNAIFTYTGISTGTDQAFASAEVAGSTIFSNDAQVTWTPGKHSTFMSLNLSPGSGATNRPLTLTATMVDVSATPIAGVAGVTLSFTLAGQTCAGTTDPSGTAICSITPNVNAGSYPLVATFAGTSLLRSNSASKIVELMDVVTQPLQSVQFSQTNYSVTEDCTTITITVNRSGDVSSAASVDYFTSDVSASDRRDYNVALGNLRFAAGETSKNFAVLINEDSFVEGTETFNVNLRNPSGASLGALATATVTINDDATEPALNVIDNAQNFVCQQYHDFLGRQPDPAGQNFWTDNITRCSDPARRPTGQTEAQCTLRQRETTSGAFFLSPEFQYTGYYIYRMYQGALGRQPRLAEFTSDAQFVGDGIVINGQLSGAKINQNKAAFAQQFVNCTEAAKSRCAEFKGIYDGLNNQQYVDKLFQTTGVNASAVDRAVLINGLNANPATETRASVLQKVVDGINVISEGNQQFTTSYGQAFYNSEFNRAFVQMEYFGYLRRDPDDAGYAHWLGKLNLYGNFVDAEMVLSFILSPEYRARFGQP